MYKSFCYFLFCIIILTSCKGQNPPSESHKFTNNLIQETSPYLLQHAHNPVNWHAWNNETLAKAKKENKLLLISIGYSACHWCHVMEHESFENEEVAKIMNDNFINIKIDREERPDIDQIYMNAVQLMTGHGGWPLNCIALPNGKPFWGGTYFPKDNWINTLTQIATIYKTESEKAIEYADKLTQGVKQSELIIVNNSTPEFSIKEIEETVQKWTAYFDHDLGGMDSAPKFPMPNNYHFLLRYAHQSKNTALKKYTLNTLNKMALGGIFDHINGGFSRYSTDKKWHIPHFEKMLYDNAQLVSLYSDAYLITKNELYKETIVKTLDFVKRELTNEKGAFYSSLDADSLDEHHHLEEGAYYVWTKKELEALIRVDFDLFSKYYNINNYGHWEKDKYHLIRTVTNKTFALNNKIDVKTLQDKISTWNQILFKAREGKQKPRLDDKTLTSWNALMLKAYVDAYKALDNNDYLKTAIKNAKFLKENQILEEGRLNHNYKNDISNINGYLGDYAAVIAAYVSLYEVTLNEEWLTISKKLADYCFSHFYDEQSKMFFFTSDLDQNLIARKMEVNDNVIPASNSILAKELFKLGHYYSNRKYINTSRQMLNNIKEQMYSYGSGYSNWLDLYCNLSTGFYEIAIVGKDVLSKIKELNKTYIPNKLVTGSRNNSNMPLLKNRYVKDKTLIYICIDGICKLPSEKISEVINLIK